MQTSTQLDFKHPNYGRPLGEIVEMACAYLPPGVADWEMVCRQQFAWLSERVSDALNAGDLYSARWMSWRSWDPVHLALLSLETAAQQQIQDNPSGFAAGWNGLLFEIHRRRFEQYRAKVKLFLVGGAG